MKTWKKLTQRKLIGIVISLVAIILFFIVYSLIGKFCFENWLKSLFSILISISTSSLFYFIGKKVSNNSAKKALAERYVYTFQHIRSHLDRDEEYWRNKYYKENQMSVQNPNPYSLMIEENTYIFDNLDDESDYLYYDILKGHVDNNILKEKVVPIINKILKPYKKSLSEDKTEEIDYYNFNNSKKVLNLLK